MLKNRIIYLIILAGLFLFYLYCDAYIPVFVIWLVLLMTAANVVLAFTASRDVTANVSRVLSTVSTEKRVVEFCIVIKNKSHLPVPIILCDAVFRDLAESGVLRRRIRTSASVKEEKRIYLSVDAPYAALVSCRIEKLRVCDAFGIASFPVKQRPEEGQLLITPSAKPERETFPGFTAAVSDSDIYSDTQRGDDRSQVFEVREYRDGDDIRRVHWSLSSKHGSLIVKEYSKPVDERCAVLLESSLTDGDLTMTKQRADRVLAKFVMLAQQLLSEERIFSVSFYAPSAKRLMEVEVKKLEDVAAVLKAFLSEVPPSEPLSSLQTYRSRLRAPSAVYYIFDSTVIGSAALPQRDEGFLPIDAAAKTA